MDGLLLVDKPRGMTSFDVIRVLRKTARTRKVGHTGTLDPDATGLLPIAFGRCTKLAKFLQLDQKGYSFELRLGTRTDSLDATGEVVETLEHSHVDRAALEAVLPRFIGEVQQRPPRFSAIWVDGKRAYELARAGVDFELSPRPIRIDSIEVEVDELPEMAQLRVECGSGTYVRSLARDLGEALETCAHAAAIRRFRVGLFTLENSVQLGDLDTPEDVQASLLSPLEMLVSLPRIDLDDDEVEDVRHGRPILAPADMKIGPGDDVALAYGGTLAAVAVGAESRGQMIIRPKRVLLS